MELELSYISNGTEWTGQAWTLFKELIPPDSRVKAFYLAQAVKGLMR